MMKLAKHLPSQMNIAGHRALPSYDGQPVTCYGCGDCGHINQACPWRQGGGMVTSDSTPNTWANVAAKGAQNQRNEDTRIEVVPQTSVWPKNRDVRFLSTTWWPDIPLNIGREQQDPSHQRRHDLSPQDEDPLPCRHHNLYCPPRSDIRGNDGIWR